MLQMRIVALMQGFFSLAFLEIFEPFLIMLFVIRQFLNESQAWRMHQIVRCRDEMTAKLKNLHDEDVRLSYSKAKVDNNNNNNNNLPGTIARTERVSRPELDDVASSLKWFETEKVIETVLVDVEKKKFRQFCNSEF